MDKDGDEDGEEDGATQQEHCHRGPCLGGSRNKKETTRHTLAVTQIWQNTVNRIRSDPV